MSRTSLPSTIPPNPGFFLHFLDEANKIPEVVAWKPAILDALHLQPGVMVLDVGCGMGADALELATLVAPGGVVTGVDFSESLVAEAARRASGRNLGVDFQIGDVQALLFPSGSFDAVRSERMLMHVPNPSTALSEMSRVLKVGGRMSVLDFDWESQFCDSPYTDTTRKIALSFCDGIKNGWVGRRLPRLFREAGMTDISVSFRTITVTYEFLQLLLGGHVVRAVAGRILTEQEADQWWSDLAQANAAGTFFYGFAAFLVSGTKA